MSVSRLSKQSIQTGFPKQQTIWDQSTSVAGMDPISGITLTSSQSSITFSSIPSTYTHLQVRGIGRFSGSGPAQMQIQFNGDTGSNYATHSLFGDSSATASIASTSNTSATNGIMNGSDAIANNFGVAVIDILDYANTNKYKTSRSLSGENNNTNGYMWFASGLWQSTSAITSITLSLPSSFVQYSSFALYGVK